MNERITPYLRKQLDNPAIARQYAVGAQPAEAAALFNTLDPLYEDDLQGVKGLVHKYPNRALLKVSYRCAAHCRFCTRIRQIGTADGDLAPEQLDNALQYLRAHPEITDVILSGGDPFYTPRETTYLLDQLAGIDSVRVLRIGTRLPIHNPASFASKLLLGVLEAVRRAAAVKPFYVLLHFAHPDELTPETRAVIRQLRATGVTLLAQTVFLKGINNDAPTLRRLFEELYWAGVTPYYLYRCDRVLGLEHFVCDLADEVRIASELRRVLSGIACPTYIVDVEGHGKIPVPLDFWQGTDYSQCEDFNRHLITL